MAWRLMSTQKARTIVLLDAFTIYTHGQNYKTADINTVRTQYKDFIAYVGQCKL